MAISAVMGDKREISAVMATSLAGDVAAGETATEIRAGQRRQPSTLPATHPLKIRGHIKQLMAQLRGRRRRGDLHMGGGQEYKQQAQGGANRPRFEQAAAQLRGADDGGAGYTWGEDRRTCTRPHGGTKTCPQATGGTTPSASGQRISLFIDLFMSSYRVAIYTLVLVSMLFLSLRMGFSERG
jgi:hypothetical protein